MVRYFITPRDTRCWRLKPILFPCIIPFWQELKENVEWILKLWLLLTFEVFYLGRHSAGQTYSITRKWLNRDALNIDDWLEVRLDKN